MGKLKVNILGTQRFGGQGVTTAYVEMVNALRARDDIEVVVNSWKPADIIHAHTIDPAVLAKLLLHRGKRVISGHVTRGSLVGSLLPWLVPITWFYYKNIYYKLADAMVAVSETTKETLLAELHTKVPIQVIDNSIDTKVLATAPKQKSEFRRELGYADSDFIIVSNGQIQPRKKFDEFVKAAEKLPDFKFIWVGGMPFKGVAADKSNLLEMVKNVPKNVLVTDVIPLEKARQYMRLSDVYFHPATQETFGISILEGAAAGLPVVLRDVPDYDHTFRPNALMSAPEDFAKNLQKLHDDKKLYKIFVAESKKLAARYDNAAAAEKLVAFYKTLL